MTASSFSELARRRAMRGSSQAPGTRTIVTFWASAPWRTSASTAPSTRRSTMKWLNRLATTPNRAPFGTTRLPSITRVVIVPLFCAVAHRVERHAFDHFEAKTVDARQLTRIVRQKADLVQAKVDEHLRAQTELAQRRVLRGRRDGGVVEHAPGVE